jgi:hypothetical protein
MIFARELTGPLTSLVKKIDQATAKNSGCSMGSFIVFLNDDEKMEKTLKEFSDKENLKHTIVALMTDPVGPKPYKIAKDADVTVVLYNEREVKANYAFGKGKMTEDDVGKIVHDLSKITPKDKK